MPQKKTVYCARGETRLVQQQWAGECDERNATIESSAWTFTDEGPLSGQALAGTLASTLIVPQGRGTLRNTVTLSNGETLVAWWLVELQR